MNKSKIKKALKHVQLFHSGQLVLKYNLQPINVSEGIDWEFKHPSNQSTYQVYLHSLPIVSDFVIVGTQTRRKKELESAQKVIQDWFVNGKNTEFAWHEHAVSNRLLNIVKFQEEAGKYKLDPNYFQEMLVDHCLFLNDDNNYKHNNHGLMMDNALISASFYIEDPELRKSYINKALFRIRTAIYRDLTKQGLHVENSPEYHNLYIVLLNQIFRTLKKYDIKLESNLNFLKDAAIKLRAALLKPNNEFPLIGDTGQTKYGVIDKTYEDIVDLEAGLVVLQNENKRKQIMSRYFTFKSGYISKTHKHFDDLSITYFNNGHDVIIDPGKYSYNKDADREYIISPEAHSTVTIENESYPLHQVGQSQNVKLRITKYFYTDEYFLIEAINNLYNDTKIKRTCVITNSDELVVIDQISKTNESAAMQLFNINEEAEITKMPSSFEIKIDKTIYTLNLFEASEDVQLEILDGFVSKEFGKKIKNKRVCFKQNSNDIVFATLLKEKDKKTNIISLDSNLLKLDIGDKILNIPI